MNRLAIIDGNNWMNRAFYSLKFMKTNDGFHTGTLFGFKNMVLGLLKNNPTIRHLCVCFDEKKVTFRHKIYPEYKYKENKDEKNDMYSNLPHIINFLKLYGIKVYFSGEYEADDFINTIVKDQYENFDSIYIYSGDKDLCQLVDGKVTIVNSNNSVSYEELSPMMVEGKFGVPPERILDWLAICGDTSDNIPGCKGIGKKGAVKLIREFGSVEEIKEKLKNRTDNKSRKFIDNYEKILLSKKLATLVIVPSLEQDKEFYKIGETCTEEINKLFSSFEFKDKLC